MKPTIVILVGPTCAGKSTLEDILSKQKGFVKLKSTTTRAPRRGEVNGYQYHFVDKPTFDHLVASEAFIEHLEFGGNYYGLTAAEAERAAAMGKPAVVVVEPYGRDQILAYTKKHDWNAVTVFVDNPPKVIAKRFMDRCVADMTFAGNKLPDVVSRYSDRLASMFDKEMGWRVEAYDRRFDYDVILHKFDESNKDYVVGFIVGIVDNLETKKVA